MTGKSISVPTSSSYSSHRRLTASWLSISFRTRDWLAHHDFHARTATVEAEVRAVEVPAGLPDHERDEAAGVQVAEHAGFRTFVAEATLAGKRQRVVLNEMLQNGFIDINQYRAAVADKSVQRTVRQAELRRRRVIRRRQTIDDMLALEVDT
mgnify:CR=1 FL=1